MILKPELENEIVEFFLLLLERGAVMILAVIVAEGDEGWGVWKVLSEEFLNFDVSLFQEFVCFGVVLARFLGNLVAYEISINENVINTSLIHFIEQLHHVRGQ